MAITATFAADFNQFVASTKTAEVALVKLEGQGAKLGTTFTTTQSNSDRFRTSLQSFDGVMASLGVNIGTEVRALGELGTAASQTATELGLISTLGLAAGAAIAGWKIGKQIDEWTGLSESIARGTAALMGWGDVAEQTMGAQWDTITRAVKLGAAATISYSDAVIFLTGKQKEQTDAMSKAGEVQRQHASEMKKIADEQARWALIMAELNSAGGHWSETLEQINGEVVEAVKFYLEAGVAQGTLATAYGLTAVQVKAISSALADQLAAEKILDDFHKVASERQKEIQTAILKATNDQVVADFNLQQQKKASDAAFLAGALADAQAQDAVNLSLGRAAQAAGATAGSINALTGSYWAAVDAAAALSGIPSIGHRAPSLEDPGFASPGFGSGGLHPLTGLHPLSNSSSIVNNFQVNGTAEDVARKVSAEIMRTIMASGKVG
jgi:ribosomal silencing factor RsfS